MKRFISLLAGLSLFAFSSFGASTSLSVSNGIMTNFTFLSASPVKITRVTITTPAATAANIQLIDTPTNTLIFTNQAYTNIISYATNQIVLWTNYYGRTNAWTNITQVDVTNTVASNVAFYNVEFAANVPTNGSILADNLNAVFTYGVWVTNSGTGTGLATVTITYQQ